GNHAPHDHDGPQPASRPQSLKHHVGRHFKEKITKEKNSCADSVDCFTHAQVMLHLEFCKTHVDTVYVGQDVTEEQEGDEVPGNSAVGRPLEVLRSPHGRRGIFHGARGYSRSHYASTLLYVQQVPRAAGPASSTPIIASQASTAP